MSSRRQFWRSFFEQAAAVKLNTQGEFTNTTALSDDVYGDAQRDAHRQDQSYSQEGYQYEDHEQTMDRSGMDNRVYAYKVTAEAEAEGEEDLSITSEDHSFLYGDQPMASSTPRASKVAGKHNKGKGHQGNPRYSDQSSVTSDTDNSYRQHHDGREHGGDEDYSLGSIHASGDIQIDDGPSPFEQLDRRLREELILDDPVSGQRGHDANWDEQADQTITGRRNEDDELYDEEPSVILRPSRDPSGSKTTMRPEATPRRVAGKGQRNEIGSPGWNGLADLRNTPLNIKVKRNVPTSAMSKFGLDPSKAGQPARLPRHLGIAKNAQPSDLTSESVESSDFGITNMSPPVTTNFGNTITRRNLEKTPAKEAVRLVIDDLMRGIGGGFSPSPVMEADAAFAKYGYGSGGMEAGPAAGTPSKSMGKRGQMLSQASRRAMERQTRNDHYEDEGDLTARGNFASSQSLDPDTSSVGMTRGYPPDAPDQSYTHDARSFLEESFVSGAAGNDSLEVDHEMQLPQGYDDPTILLGGQPFDPNALHQGSSPSPADHRQRVHYQQQDLLDAETTMDPDTYQGLRRDEPTATMNTMMTTNSDLLRFSPASSDAASVFGGTKHRGAPARGGGFALLGADDIHTFHGGVGLPACCPCFKTHSRLLTASRRCWDQPKSIAIVCAKSKGQSTKPTRWSAMR